MHNLLYEAKKIFIHHKGIYIFIISLIMEFAFLNITATPLSEEMEIYKEDYQYFLSYVSGSCDFEKETYLNKLASEIAYARQTLPSLYKEYYSGIITPSDFFAVEPQLNSLLRSSSGFNALYNQYLYVRENTINRYFVYTNGWNALLCTDKVDPVLLLGLLLLITPTYCYEYSSCMHSLSLTQQYGSQLFSWGKIFISNTVALTFSAAIFIQKIIYCSILYGLPHSNFPLQSLSYFGTYVGTKTLLQVTIFYFAYQSFGVIFFVNLILLCSSYLKHYAISCFVPICFIVIPMLLFPDTVQYRLPLPLAFFRSSGFFRGTSTTSFSDNTTVFTFYQLTTVERIFVILFSSLEISICIYLTWKKNQNHFLRNTKRYSVY